MAVDLAIIGAQKAGTTSLKEYLSQHPSIQTHPQIEFSFFRDEELYLKGYAAAEKKYLTLNPNTTNKKTLIKNVGIYSSTDALERLYKHNPECKIIFIVRNPIARAYSSYNMERFNGWYQEDFDGLKEVIKNKKFDEVSYRLFVSHGLYVNHLKNIYSLFPKHQVKIIEYDFFLKNTLEVCKEIMQWSGIDSLFNFDVNKIHNETRKENSAQLSSILMSLRSNKNVFKRIAKAILPYTLFTKMSSSLLRLNKSKNKSNPMSPEMKDFLHEYFTPFNLEFDQLAGTDFSSRWNDSELT